MSDRNKLERLYQHAGAFLFVLGTSLGHRNGYMRIPDDHPWHKLLLEMEPKPPTDYNELTDSVNRDMDETGYEGPRLPQWPDDLQSKMNAFEHRRSVTWYDWMSERISIHGGWTFADQMTAENFEYWIGQGHDGIPPGIWFGFDCGHYRDGVDIGLMRELEVDEELIRIYSERQGHVWTTDEVAAELNRAAEELAAARILEASYG